MKTLLIISIATLITISTGNSVCAQEHDQQGPPPVPNKNQIEKMVGELSRELALTEQQSKQISKMYKEHFAEVKKKAERIKQEMEAHRKEMDDLRRNFENKVKALLTEEQKNLFNEFQKSHHPPERPERER